jgi:hypothetical protein
LESHVRFDDYSYRKASMGLSAAALHDRYQPKMRPMLAEKEKDKRIDDTVMTTDQPPILATNCEMKTPKAIPISPPKKLITIDSIINCDKISRPLAQQLQLRP